jgi:hypothetical protein
VLSDLRDELISFESAVDVYGIDPTEAEAVLAEHGWERRRTSLRAARQLSP